MPGEFTICVSHPGGKQCNEVVRVSREGPDSPQGVCAERGDKSWTRCLGFLSGWPEFYGFHASRGGSSEV